MSLTAASGVGAGDLIGFYALLYLYVGYLCGKANRLFFPEDILLPLGLKTHEKYAPESVGTPFHGFDGVDCR